MRETIARSKKPNDSSLSSIRHIAKPLLPVRGLSICRADKARYQVIASSIAQAMSDGEYERVHMHIQEGQALLKQMKDEYNVKLAAYRERERRRRMAQMYGSGGGFGGFGGFGGGGSRGGRGGFGGGG